MKVTGFHHGILRIAMEPSLLGTAFLEGGPDRRIKLDRSPGIDEVNVSADLMRKIVDGLLSSFLSVNVAHCT